MRKGRKPCCDKSQVKRGPWSPAEDLRLITYIQKNGHDNWRAIPKLSGLRRCGKSCRLRWINYLRPDVKRGNFTNDEEETIIKLHHDLGNKWAKIASHLPGRTDNEIKNVWNTHLKKRSRLSIDNDNPSGSESKDNSSSPTTSSSFSSASSTISQLADGKSDDRDENNDIVLKEATNEGQASISTTSISSNSSNSITINPNIMTDDEDEILLIDAVVFDESETEEVNDLLSDVSKPKNSVASAPNHEALMSWPQDDREFWGLLDSLDTRVNCDMEIDDSKKNAELNEKRKWLKSLECELGLDRETMASDESQSQQQVLDHPVDSTVINTMFSIETENEPGFSWDLGL